jgi:hypothetical protein
MRLTRLLPIALCAALSCYAQSKIVASQKVASEGVTEIGVVLDKRYIFVKITAHEIDIGKSSDKHPQERSSNCTYSRFPCSVVDHLEISVDGHPLFVARSVYSDLADLTKASLSDNKAGGYELIMNGGDASESYTVKVTFNASLVGQRTLRNNEAGQVMQRTIYFADEAYWND